MADTSSNKGITTVITFDVSGQIYRISRDLLWKFPSIRLCTPVASSETEKDGGDDEKNHHPMIIRIEGDRNGFLFQYVMDFLRDSSSLCLPSTVDQYDFFREMEYYGFRCYHDTFFPKGIRQIPGISYHTIQWDVTRASTDLSFQWQNHVVVSSKGSSRSGGGGSLPRATNNKSSSPTWNSVLGTVGFTTGIHYWSVEIMQADDADENNNYDNSDMMIGISSQLSIVMVQQSNSGTIKMMRSYNTTTTYQHATAVDFGVNYHGKTGHRCCNGKDFGAFGPPFGKKGDVIGTLLNMNDKTLTFYKNGIRIGTAADVDELNSHATYYPCVSLSSSHHQEIRSICFHEIIGY